MMNLMPEGHNYKIDLILSKLEQEAINEALEVIRKSITKLLKWQLRESNKH